MTIYREHPANFSVATYDTTEPTTLQNLVMFCVVIADNLDNLDTAAAQLGCSCKGQTGKVRRGRSDGEGDSAFFFFAYRIFVKVRR